jgi:hypothetical protein
VSLFNQLRSALANNFGINDLRQTLAIPALIPLEIIQIRLMALINPTDLEMACKILRLSATKIQDIGRKLPFKESERVYSTYTWKNPQ